MVDKTKIYKAIDEFKNTSVSIVGDIMLDVYKKLPEVKKLSNNRPVFDFNEIKSNYYLGGAGNVLSNLVALGVNDVSIYSLIGDDRGGKHIKHIIKNLNCKDNIIICKESNTTVKTVFTSSDHRANFRLDKDGTKVYDSKIYEEFNETLETIESKVLIISDYNKGLLTTDVMLSIDCSDVFVSLDPSIRDVKDYYSLNSIDHIKMNFNEACYLTGINDVSPQVEEDYYRLAYVFYEKFGCSYVTITSDSEGMYYCHFPNEYDPIQGMIKSYVKKVKDATGAGDTVISVLAMALANGLDVKHAHIIASKAAAIVVEKNNTNTVTYDELMN